MSSASTKASIALSRFGYGLRLGERPPNDPKRFLLRQMDAYDASPSHLAGREDTTEQAGEILQEVRRQRRQRQSAMETEGQGATANRNRSQSSMETTMTGDASMASETRERPRRSVPARALILRRDIGLRTQIALESDTPMIERLVHFWSNHFSVSAAKPGTPQQVGNHEFRAIRPHVLGKFGDMLKAATLHPAMLLYLDQFRSAGPNSSWQTRRRRRGNGRERGLNENLAREILELHTVGVNGGYSQSDVTEFARALTGWTIRGLMGVARLAVPQSPGSDFLEVAHEPGTRTIMGRQYKDTGAKQALAVLDDLATHPKTARFITTKFARHFTGDKPPASLVAKLEKDFLRTGGDLGSLLRTLIEAPEAWATEPQKFRAPYEWLIAVLRMVDTENLRPQLIASGIRELGQTPWRATSPAGYDDFDASWAGPDALFRRIELAERVARLVPSDNVIERAETAFPGSLSDQTRTWLSRAESNRQALGLLFVAPEMMRR